MPKSRTRKKSNILDPNEATPSTGSINDSVSFSSDKPTEELKKVLRESAGGSILFHLMYQQRRDSARFDHITTTQRNIWAHYCLTQQAQETELYRLAFNHGALQELKSQKDELMTEARTATPERKREILDKVLEIRKKMEVVVGG